MNYRTVICRAKMLTYHERSLGIAGWAVEV